MKKYLIYILSILILPLVFSFTTFADSNNWDFSNSLMLEHTHATDDSKKCSLKDFSTTWLNDMRSLPVSQSNKSIRISPDVLDSIRAELPNATHIIIFTGSSNSFSDRIINFNKFSDQATVIYSTDNNIQNIHTKFDNGVLSFVSGESLTTSGFTPIRLDSADLGVKHFNLTYYKNPYGTGLIDGCHLYASNDLSCSSSPYCLNYFRVSFIPPDGNILGENFYSREFHNVYYSTFPQVPGFTMPVSDSLEPYNNIVNPQINIITEVGSTNVRFDVLESSAFGSVGNPADVELREALKVDLDVINVNSGSKLIDTRLDYHLGGYTSAIVTLPSLEYTKITGRACYYLPDDKKDLLPSSITGLGCRFFDLDVKSGVVSSTDVLSGHNESDGTLFNSINNSIGSVSGLGGIFHFTWLNPFSPIFALFHSNESCIYIPTLSAMLNVPNNQYCPWFSGSTRSILTPVLGISSIMLVFGVFIYWLGGGGNDGSVDLGRDFTWGKK